MAAGGYVRVGPHRWWNTCYTTCVGPQSLCSAGQTNLGWAHMGNGSWCAIDEQARGVFKGSWVLCMSGHAETQRADGQYTSGPAASVYCGYCRHTVLGRACMGNGGLCAIGGQAHGVFKGSWCYA